MDDVIAGISIWHPKSVIESGADISGFLESDGSSMALRR